MKKLLLITAIASVASTGFAMEAVDDMALSNISGQAGLSIVTVPDVTIGALRYTDTDGTSLVAGYANRGTLMIEDLTLKATKVSVDIDVGSTATASDKTSLFIKQSVEGLDVTLGKISLDHGAVMDYDPAANGGAGAVKANVTNNAAFGELALTHITIPAANLQITPGGNAGDGLTVKALNDMNVSLDMKFTDTDNGNDAQGNAIGAGSISLLGVTDDRGIEIKGMKMGETTIDVLPSGLRIGQGETTIGSVRIGSADSGIQIGGASMGQVALLGVKLGTSVTTIAGH